MLVNAVRMPSEIDGSNSEGASAAESVRAPGVSYKLQRNLLYQSTLLQ